MTITEIKDKLGKKGFYAYITSDTVIAGMLKETDPDTGLKTISYAFDVKVVENKSVLGYGQAQVPKEKSFETTDSLIDFIVKNYPFV